ncbi:ribonuclease HII [Candidatus Bathyarchaeota archaeon RBG_13_60_20]|nr:MAG: ribonuclease HII [Candidatus Bathyarchaeota archaeon RBG_13_60_20]
MRVAGVDEAGRGCAIGPLVIAGALFQQSDIPKLIEAGVKDSKKLTPRMRRRLYETIIDMALDHRIVELPPATIDKVVNRSVPLRRLNYLETMVMARVVRELRPDSAYVDTCDVDHMRCGRQIQSVIPFNVDITCVPKADNLYPATAAASILAKVRRDKVVAELREAHGDFGSGYCGDHRTIQFIEAWFRDNRESPPFMRASWAPVKKYLAPLRQARLSP